MRLPSMLALLFSAIPALAQNWYIPDNVATSGGCNVIPFGQQVGGPFYQCKYQQRCTATELGATVNLITGLAFAPCQSGRAHYDTLEIVLDHIPASQPLTATFASNLTPNAVTVLFATNYTWNVTVSTWNEVGLQVPFVYNGTDDLVVQVTTVNGTAPLQGMRTGNHQRLWWVASSGTPAPTGNFDNAAQKIEVSMLTAHTSSHGDGCAGSNGTPRLSFTGSAQVGQTLSIDLVNGVPSGVSLLIVGTTNSFPFPLELSFLGMPSCYLYTDMALTSIVFNDAVGSGSFVLPIPASAFGLLFYSQFACLDPPANPFGFTSSTYGRVLCGL
ncbi:MAG TPA: hypothetical protein VFD82_18530 [Planctomycetota bacterium]|nr:hypothetical protein [Planctomycetota bacterium]